VTTVWDELEQDIVALYSLPHNRLELLERPELRDLTPQQFAQKKIAEIKSGMDNVRKENFTGPRVFLRVIGATTVKFYRGEWWFEASLLDALERDFSRIFFTAADKKRVIRDMLRELLAISSEWNQIAEVWSLQLPPGHYLKGYSGPGLPQKLFANLPLTDKANRMLIGKAKQVYFPVKNPLWVAKYENLAH
jgi:hypothetical protein